jgi:Fe-S-cluster containining protein
MVTLPFYSKPLQTRLELLNEKLKIQQSVEVMAKACLDTLIFFHQELDTWKTKNTSNICKSKCSHCCSHWVDGLDSFEALAIYHQLRSRKDFTHLLTLFFERDTLFEKHSLTSLEYDDTLDLFFKDNLGCPTLSSDATCTIYSFRPLICSLYQAQKSSELCKPNMIEKKPENNQILEIDLRHQKLLATIDSNLRNLNIPESYFQAMLHLFENETK